MARIVPFRGLRYRLDRVNDPATVMAPPYDVISPALQESLYQRNPHNVVRLILGRTAPADTATDNRYTRAASDFSVWQQDGVLQRDAAPSLYLYDQIYALEDGSSVTRQGFIALTRIEDFSSGVVKPHEKTLAGPKADRLLLTRACQANFSPIFSLYADPGCTLESHSRCYKDQTPAVDVADDDGVRHRLWCVDEPAFIAQAQALLDRKPLFIADGHHRYETALNYRNEQREQHPGFTGQEPFNFVLMYFSNMEDQGMTIFPTHRVLFGLAAFDAERLLRELAEFFTIEVQALNPENPAQLAAARQRLAELGAIGRTIGCYAGGERFCYLTLKDEAVMDRCFDPGAPRALRTLDVSILHRLILEGQLGLSTQAQEQQTNLRYVKGFEEPFALVRRGEGQVAFLMNATRIGEVRDVANAGEKMPQKSTYFYPKLLTGLVINRMFDGENFSV